MSYETIDLEILDDGALAVVHLNRPQARNALDPRLARDFVLCMREIGGREGLRAAVVTGRGSAFSAGGDLAAFHATDDPRHFLHELAVEYHEGIIGIRRMRVPFVAAINGACFGAGLALACACDFRIAASDAKLCFGFLGIGLSPDSGLPYFLPRIVGLGKAVELAMLNPVIDAQEALSIHLVSGVVDPGALMSEALSLARRLAAAPTVAVGRLKRLYDDCYSDGLDAHLAKQLRGVAETASTQDFREGCAAFLERRKPSFSGR